MLAALRPRPSALLGAIALDALFGDPPTALHPVGWIGRLVRGVEAGAPASATARRQYGAVAAPAITLLTALAAAGWHAAPARRGLPGVLAEAVALDGTFALRTLLRRADEVRVALEADDLDAARGLLGRHLVSREVHDLTASEIAGATIESVAENLGDGVVAPWLAYAVAGLPGAFAYRAANTLDSMWGYRSERYADLGFVAATTDDVANWVPARVAALAIVAAAAVAGEDAAGAVEAWRRDASTTESPNAGHPMSAMAGALGVVLSKRDAYTLGATGRPPVAGDIARALVIARIAAAIAAAGATVIAARGCAR